MDIESTIIDEGPYRPVDWTGFSLFIFLNTAVTFAIGLGHFLMTALAVGTLSYGPTAVLPEDLVRSAVLFFTVCNILALNIHIWRLCRKLNTPELATLVVGLYTAFIPINATLFETISPSQTVLKFFVQWVEPGTWD